MSFSLAAFKMLAFSFVYSCLNVIYLHVFCFVVFSEVLWAEIWCHQFWEFLSHYFFNYFFLPHFRSRISFGHSGDVHAWQLLNVLCLFCFVLVDFTFYSLCFGLGNFYWPIRSYTLSTCSIRVLLILVILNSRQLLPRSVRSLSLVLMIALSPGSQGFLPFHMSANCLLKVGHLG